MKRTVIAVLVIFVTATVFALAYAGSLEDSIARGEALFKDKRAFGGNRACEMCHPNGKGLDKAAEKKRFLIMGKMARSLEEAINLCIEYASKGTPIDVNSQKMEDLVNYIKSF